VLPAASVKCRQRGATREPSHVQDLKPLSIIGHMLFSWLKAQSAISAGAALADSFPTQAAGPAVGEFLRSATQELRARNLNFYHRVRFANAFKWRLLENGVAADTARDVTQTLLISSSGKSAPTPATAPAAAPAPAAARTTAAADTRANDGPVDGKALEALFRQGEEALGQGRFDDSIAHYQAYLVARPRDSGALNNLAVALLKLGRYADAADQLRKAVARNPKNADAYTNLGNALLQLHRYGEAEEAFRRVVSLQSTDLAARSSLGLSLTMMGRLDKARSEFETVLKTTPEHAGALAGMGLLERASGHAAEAEALLWRAVQADPHLIRAWAAIPSLRRMTQGDSRWLQNAEKLASATRLHADEAALRYALGKYYDDTAQYAQALTSFQRANTLLKLLVPAFDATAYAALVQDMTNTYTADSLASARISDSSPLRHVFVVGMQRSGVALTGQILASHPEVTGVSQLDFWLKTARGEDNRVRRKVLSENARRKLASEYVAAIKRLSPNADAVVEATPVNADYVGLIYSVLPDARFIFMHRDPVDTCLSCYFQPFNGTQNFAFDLTDLAAYATEHARLIDHWRGVLPSGTILNVSYEELVANREPTTRRLLDFLGLGLDERCLQLPLQADSVGRARHYAKFVTPLAPIGRT
jgi:tetratricopeptide (TPR) repeat protein